MKSLENNKEMLILAKFRLFFERSSPVTGINHQNVLQNHFFRFHKTIAFDGVWNDMNEPSNELSGSPTGCTSNPLNNPPYIPTIDQNLNVHTICMDAKQHLGTHYQLHNLYGFTETRISSKVLKKIRPGKRPFILSRSTFPGIFLLLFFCFAWDTRTETDIPERNVDFCWNSYITSRKP